MKTDSLKPFQVTRRELRRLFSSPSLVDRMIRAGWIIQLRAGGPGREAFFDYASAEQAYARWHSGEEPAPLKPTIPTCNKSTNA